MPKIGDCYTYQVVSIYDINAKGKSVKCTETHNSETYRIGKTPSNFEASEITPITFTSVAAKICTPWKGKSKYLNQWVYRVPTKTQWLSGERWVICEAIRVEQSEADTNQLDVVSFKNKKLDFK